MALPPPSTRQAYCHVSALEAGLITLPLKNFITTSEPDATLVAPSLAFLVQHSAHGHKLLFDLGIRRDWGNYPATVVAAIKHTFSVHIPQDVVESLAKGGTAPSEIDVVCLSHCHFDHVGDTAPFADSTFVVGERSAGLLRPGYPSDPASAFASDLLPPSRTQFLSFADAPPLGPFPCALDFYGDGSLYIVDSPGHLPGHINLLARTSPDGGWIYLAGDSAHHWDLITGGSDIAVTHVGNEHVCAHADKAVAEEHISRIKELWKIPRVRVLIAHDQPWYDENKGGSAFWPGKIASL